LDLAVLRIHTIDIFRIEKHSRILTLDIYIKRNTSVYKASRHITSRILGGFYEGS
jgi:hypothetical protein